MHEHRAPRKATSRRLTILATSCAMFALIATGVTTSRSRSPPRRSAPTSRTAQRHGGAAGRGRRVRAARRTAPRRASPDKDPTRPVPGDHLHAQRRVEGRVARFHPRLPPPAGRPRGSCRGLDRLSTGDEGAGRVVRQLVPGAGPGRRPRHPVRQGPRRHLGSGPGTLS